MIPVEQFIGALVALVTLIAGGYGLMFRQLLRQAEQIAKLNETALADKDRQIQEANSDRDFFRERLFQAMGTADVSVNNTRRAMDRGGFPTRG